jgi:uncharacterized membrane protein
MGHGKPGDGAVRAFLCVGLAYFVTAVLIPIIALAFGLAGNESLEFNAKAAEGETPQLNTYAIGFSTLGGIAGAAGALCIIFSIKNGGPPLYVAPLVFAGAPIVNAIVSVLWHPPEELGKSEYLPGWIMFIAGILLAAAGAGLVLYSKGYIDDQKRLIKQARVKAAALAKAADPPPGLSSSTAIHAPPDAGIREDRNT